MAFVVRINQRKLNKKNIVVAIIKVAARAYFDVALQATALTPLLNNPRFLIFSYTEEPDGSPDPSPIRGVFKI